MLSIKQKIIIGLIVIVIILIILTLYLLYFKTNVKSKKNNAVKENFYNKNMVVMGVNSSTNIYYANQNIKTSPNWTQIPGGLSNVSYSNGQAYGVNSVGNIFYNADYTSSNWIKVPGGLSQVSFDGYNMIVMGVNSSGNIYYANRNITSSPNWTQVGGVLTNLSYSNGQVYGVNSAGNIYYNANYTSSNWVQVPGRLSQVSFDGYNMIVMGVIGVIGVNRSGNVYYANQNITTSPNWTQLGGILSNLSYTNGQLYGVNSAGNIYYNSNYISNNWVQVQGGLSQVSFEDCTPNETQLGYWECKSQREYDKISLPIGTVIRYGNSPNAAYVQKTITSSSEFIISNSFFGRDPIYGFVKNLYVFVPFTQAQLSARRSGYWVLQSQAEGANITLPIGTIVRYGDTCFGSYVEKTITSSSQFTINNTFFGRDPVPKSAKYLYVFAYSQSTTDNPISNNIYQLKNINSNKCLYNNADGRFSTSSCDSNYNDQQWKFIPIDINKNIFQLQSKNSNNCFYNNADGRFSIAGCNSNYNDQHWKFIPIDISNNIYQLQSINSINCLYNNADGRFSISGCNSNNNDQHWKLMEITTPPPAPAPPPPAPRPTPAPPASAQPPNTKLAEVPEGNRTYSSVFANEPKGTGHARSTINSPQAWSSSAKTPGDFMIINLPAVSSVSGIAVQGRKDYKQYVTKITCNIVNNDGSETPIDNGRTYNTNLTSAPDPISYILFSNPVNAKSIKIICTEFIDWISLRADILLNTNPAPVAPPVTAQPPTSPLTTLYSTIPTSPSTILYSTIPTSPSTTLYNQQTSYNEQPLDQSNLEQPYFDQPYFNQPYFDQPYMRKPYMQQPYMQQPIMNPYMQQPYMQQPIMQQPNVEKPNIIKSSEFDISNNQDNLNDFMAKNTLLGSNLYISPMNSTGINDIKNKKQYGSSKISSSFFPIVKLS